MSEKTFLKRGANSETSSLPFASDEASALEDPSAVAHETKVRVELNTQFKELKRQAEGVFDAVKGRIGARNEEYLEQVFAKAREENATGHPAADRRNDGQAHRQNSVSHSPHFLVYNLHHAEQITNCSFDGSTGWHPKTSLMR
jgi:hypothetical protein